MSIFSGSYLKDDVHFLLKPIQIASTPIKEKEKLIQSGKKHYSEMITKEGLPSLDYVSLFHQIFSQNQQRLALDLLKLAAKIHQQKPAEIILCSLARAGTPIGVLLKRILQQYFNRKCVHYSISIIRDRGIDNNALHYILKKHSNPQAITFIDGWTGKGVINQELQKSISEFNKFYQTEINADLYVLNDIAGVAAHTASFDDYLIPSSLLNATISGLISRSILNSDYIAESDFHGCLYYSEFESHDLTQWFIAETMKAVANLIELGIPVLIDNNQWINREQIQKKSVEFMTELKETYQITNINLIKPGIGEATRVLLRRDPDLLILKKHTEEVQHLLMLAKQKQIPVVENLTMPYQATAIIAEHQND